ncbi:MAG: LacI family transcriptional regulator [Lachnospiraceae bacterium]|jgi:LacI family transcriptional regulator|nr:LacI family transcriptional regulator [Lachnospiraceae bacterium]
MATLKDVANLACVDVSTVSRALNNTSYVHPDTKERILKAVKELSYHPNIIAKSLKQGKRHTIGVVIPRLSLTVFAVIAQTIEEEARKNGYATLICNTEDDPKIEKECLNRLRSGFVDGIIIAGTGKNNRLIRDIHSTGIAITQIVRRQDPGLNSVTVNYEKCGYEATKYLYNLGCREIGLINGPMNIAPYKERYNGYSKAINELGINETTASSKIPVHSLEYGYECAIELLDKSENLDGIMAAVDAQAIGAMRALKDNNISVPDDIHLLSLTGDRIGKMLETSMTSFEMPVSDIGINAAKTIIEEIENTTTEKSKPKNIVFLSKLVKRESS